MSYKLKSLVLIVVSIFFLGISLVLASENLDLNLNVYTCNNNSTCDSGENSTYCPTDCVCDNDGTCDAGENSDNCSNDCGGTGGPGVDSLSISGITVSNITDNSAKIDWLTNNTATCQLVWGLTTDYSAGSVGEVTNSLTHSTNLTSLSPASTYHFKISCTDIYASSQTTGDNFFTTSSTIDTTAPSNVTGLRAVPGNQHIVLYWVNPSDVDFSAVVIRRSTDYFPSLSEGTVVYDGTGEAVGSEVSYDDLNLTNDTLYYYSVFAYDTSNNYASGVGVSATPRQATTTPNNVSNLRIVPGDERLTLYWLNPSDIDFAGVIIRRSTASNPSFTSGSLVYDGTGYPAGEEFSFPNTNLTNDLTYYYTVFAYNNAGFHAGGVSISGTPIGEVTTTTTSTPPTTTTPPFTTSTPPTTTTPPFSTTTKDLFFKDFIFYQNNQNIPVKPEDLVDVNIDQDITISLPEAKALEGTEKIVLNLSVNGSVQSYLFNYNSVGNSYSASLPALGTEGKYWATIVLLDSDNKVIKTVYGWIEVKKPQIIEEPAVAQIIKPIQKILKPVEEALKPIQEVAQSTVGQTTAAATVAVSIANVAVAVPWWNWWYLLQFIFTQPFQLFFRRKGWGVVYNSITKKPVDLALVRLYDAKTNKLISSRVTDRNGRYIFLVDAGSYYVRVEKPGFEFPSQLLKRSRDDGSYLDLYYGNEINVSEGEKVAIVANIPLDQEDKKISDQEIISRFSKERNARYLSWAGPIISFVYLLIFPSWFALAISLVHILVLIYFRRSAQKKTGKNWGIVYDVSSKQPLKRAITRIFSSEYGRMLEFYVTDNQGRYGFLVGDNKYYVTADKDGYSTAKTPVLDLTKVDKSQELIAKDLGLVKSTENHPSPTETINNTPTEVLPTPPTSTIQAGAPIEKSPIPESAPQITKESTIKPTEVAPEIKAPSASIDLGSIGELKENLNIGPETETQKQKMDLDDGQSGK